MIEYHIIYPSGDRTQLAVLEYNTERYDLSEYALAARHSFQNLEQANAYGRKLAGENGLRFRTLDASGKSHDYLD